MKINLSKEHIEKGCELVEDYEFNRGSLLVGGCFAIDPHVDGMTKPMKALYRDFLQLVIEGINKKYEDTNIYIAQDVERITVKNWHNHRMVKNYTFTNNSTQAKEKAIAYVFDNMEVRT